MASLLNKLGNLIKVDQPQPGKIKRPGNNYESPYRLENNSVFC
jgi:hypothetical protein